MCSSDLNVNRMKSIGDTGTLKLSDMRPSKEELKRAFPAMIRGTVVGTIFGAMPGTGPTITTFIAYALERKVSKTPAALASPRAAWAESAGVEEVAKAV